MTAAAVVAHVEHDLLRQGVRLFVADRDSALIMGGRPDARPLADNELPPANAPLLLTESQARAVYEALADYYGHAGHDTRALRKDYDAERARVDRLIGHLVGP